ncbi:MAG: hypothetical protein ACR2LT_06040, partial [Pyrinomonadaceae bacterium]
PPGDPRYEPLLDDHATAVTGLLRSWLRGPAEELDTVDADTDTDTDEEQIPTPASAGHRSASSRGRFSTRSRSIPRQGRQMSDDPPDPPVTVRRVRPAGACAERLPGRYPALVMCGSSVR